MVVPGLFAGSFPRQGRFDSLFLSWLQIKGMLFDFLDDVLLLHLSLEAAEGAFQRLSLLKSNFSQRQTPPFPSEIKDALFLWLPGFSPSYHKEVKAIF